jgi:hypothetical protein
MHARGYFTTMRCVCVIYIMISARPKATSVAVLCCKGTFSFVLLKLNPKYGNKSVIENVSSPIRCWDLVKELHFNGTFT